MLIRRVVLLAALTVTASGCQSQRCVLFVDAENRPVDVWVDRVPGKEISNNPIGDTVGISTNGRMCVEDMSGIALFRDRYRVSALRGGYKSQTFSNLDAIPSVVVMQPEAHKDESSTTDSEIRIGR